MTHPNPNPETIASLVDTTWRMAAEESARTEALDRKGTSLATFASLVLPLTVALGGRSLERLRGDVLLEPVFMLYAASLLGQVGSLGLAVQVLVPKEHLTLGLAYLERFPTWSEILKPPEQVRGEIMRGVIRAIAQERTLNNRRARQLTWAFRLLFLGLLLVVFAGATLAARTPR